MGKSEILMLLAGVALSIMLAMVAIPMFSSGQDMTDRQQVQQELLAIKSAIPLIKGIEGDDDGTITFENIDKHMKGFKKGTGVLIGEKELANYAIKDNEPSAKTITITVTSTSPNVILEKLTRLNEICDAKDLKDVENNKIESAVVVGNKLTCIMKREN